VAALAVMLAAPCAYAQTEPQKQQQSGTLVYEPSFFADARPNTAFDMIRRLPGFTFEAGETARGFAGTAGNVLIDGQRPTSKTDSLDSIIGRIPAADVERIEIIRGGAPGIDMQGKAVVANIVRKKAESTRVVLDVSNNFFFDGHQVTQASVEYTRHAGERTYEASLTRYGGYDDSVGLGTRTITRGGATQLDFENRRAVGFGEGLTGAMTLPLWGGQFKGNVILQSTPFRSDLTFTTPSLPPLFVQDVISRTGNENAELGLHWQGPMGGLELETLALQRLGRETSYNVFVDPTTDQRFLATNKTSESIVRGTLRYRPSETLSFEGGLEGAYNYLDGTSSFTLDGVPIALPSANVTVDEKRGEAFGQGTWKVNSELTLEAGARFEFSTISESGDSTNQRSFFYPKPRVLVSWSPDTDTQLRFRYERVLGQLDFGNFVATSDLGGSGVSAGNEDLRPDQRDQFELSFERHFWGRGAIVVTLLHEEIKDVVDLVPITIPGPGGGTFDAPGNIGAGINNQIDLEMTLPLDRLGLKNGLLKTTTILRNSRVHDPVTGEIRVISGQRQQDIELALTQDIESVKSTWGINYFNGWRERYYRVQELRDRRILPGLVNVFWQYKPTSDWMVHFEVDNIWRFVYDDKHYRYDVSRASGMPDELEERVVRSQPRLYVEIRKTFG
jgi:outer membrane receptor protein involved in Fe transport